MSTVRGPEYPPVIARTGRACRLLALLVLALATLYAFWPALENDFITSYDDEDYVTKNYNVRRGLTAPGIMWALGSTHAANWHPLTWISHMLDWELYGPAAWGHHLTSLLLHVGNTLLLFLVLQAATGSILRSSVVAGLFGVHPLHVESVAWVAERKDVLSTLFWLLAAWAYVRYARAPSLRGYLPVAAGLALGLSAKPMLVTLPLTFLLLDYWPLGRFAASGPAAGGPWPLWRLLREKAPLLALAAVSCVITLVAQSSARALGTMESFPLPARAANAASSYLAYLLKTVWPVDLAVFYPHPLGSFSAWRVAGATGVLAVATALAVWARRRAPYVLVGWLWYLGTLVPVIGLVQVGRQAMADRYTYVPLIGIFLLLAWGLPDALRSARTAFLRRRGGVPSAARDSRWLLLPAGVALTALATCTRAQTGTWRDSATLFGHALAVTHDNDVAHSNLGHALALKGRTEEAIRHYLEALRLNPGDIETRNNLATVLVEQGRVQDALGHLKEVLRLRPDHPEAHNNLGLALHTLGRVEEALPHYARALRLRPDSPEFHNNMGVLLAQQGRLAEASEHYAEALRIHPEYAEAHNNLGLALGKQGRGEEAIRHYETALRLKPDHAKARNNLGRALADSGRPGQAVGHYEAALRLKPDYAEAHNNLGIALFRMGRVEEAARHYMEALRIHPDYAEARSNLGGALTEQGKLDEAVGHLSEAIRIRPAYGVAHYNLAVAFYLKGDPARAWVEVALARRNGFEPPPRFVEMLSEKLPEPKPTGG